MPEETTVTFEMFGDDAALTFTNPAQLNQMWGSIASQLGQGGFMGGHSSSHGAFTPDPGDGGRTGVGNLSEDDPNFQLPDGDGNNLADGGQGLHAVFQGALLAAPFIPPDSVESTIGVLRPETHGNVEFELLI